MKSGLWSMDPSLELTYKSYRELVHVSEIHTRSIVQQYRMEMYS